MLDRPTISPSRVEPHHQDPTKYNLYSEIEKLTVLNLDLKKQNESLIRELEKQSFLITRIPELETKILDMEKDLAKKDAALAQSLRDNDFMRKDLIGLQKLEPAYNELYAHNKRLLSEIDDLNGQLENALSEKVRLEREVLSLNATHARLTEALKRIDDLNSDLEEKTRELINTREQAKNLNEKVRLLTFENDRLQGMYNDAQKDILYLKNLQNEMQKGHGEQLIQIADRLENERKANQQDKIELTSKFLADKAQLDEELKSAHHRIEELHNKLSLMVAENEKLHKINVDANKEIENLNHKIFQIEERAAEAQENLEREKRSQLDAQAKELTLQLIQQRQFYEERVNGLKNEITELEKLKDVIRDMEKEIENLRGQNQYNEETWQKKHSQVLESEKDRLITQFEIEKSELQNEIELGKSRIADLEEQVNLLTIEVERLTNLHEEKEHAILEHKSTMVLQEQETRTQTEELKRALNAQKKQELENLENNLRKSYEAQIALLKDKIADLEEKVMRLVEENSKLMELNQERLNEIEEKNYQLQAQEQKSSQMIQELEKKHENVLKHSIAKEVSSVQSRNAAEITKLQNRINDLNKEIDNLNDKCRHYEDEINRLNKIIEEKHIEVKGEQERFVDYDAKKRQEIAALHQYLEDLKQANIDLTNAIVRFDAERAALNSQIYQLKEKIGELERKLALQTEENDKQRKLYNEKVEDLENLRKTLVEVQETFDHEKERLEKEIDNLTFAKLDIQELTIRHSSEKAQYENQIRQLKTLYENGKEELEKLYETMAQRKSEHEFQLQQNENLKRQIEELNARVRELDALTQTQRERNTGLNRKAEELEQERNIYKEKLEKLNEELTETNNDLMGRIADVDNLKRRYEKSLETSTQLNTQLMNKLMKNE